ncbi:MAG: hypothetical protein LBR26_02205 [Prevotella sp.]|nr:hypothetical protein [Prevotella sp.]
MQNVRKSCRDGALLTVDGAERDLRETKSPRAPKSRRDDAFTPAAL